MAFSSESERLNDTPDADDQETTLHDAEDFHFPVLGFVLSSYFTKDHRDVLFYEEYAEYGEDSIRFAGLKDDLAAAIKSPNKAAQDLHLALNLPEGTLTPAQVRQELMDVYDKITAAGKYSPAAQRRAQAEEVDRLRDDPERMFNAYARRNVTLPSWLGPLGGRQFPLVGFAAVGAALMAVAIGLNSTNVAFLSVIASIFGGIGILLFSFGVISMFFLRGAIRSVDAEDETDKDEGAAAKKSGGRKRWVPFLR